MLGASEIATQLPLQGRYETVNKLEINKNLKFRKGVGIAIKSKETSGKLAI